MSPEELAEWRADVPALVEKLRRHESDLATDRKELRRAEDQANTLASEYAELERRLERMHENAAVWERVANKRLARADALQARIDAAPHTDACMVARLMPRPLNEITCTCWKSS